jgi:hypothetical protein
MDSAQKIATTAIVLHDLVIAEEDWLQVAVLEVCIVMIFRLMNHHAGEPYAVLNQTKARTVYSGTLVASGLAV